MKKQDYRKPTTKIVLLQQQTHLLNSTIQGELGDPQDAIEQNWDDEE